MNKKLLSNCDGGVLVIISAFMGLVVVPTTLAFDSYMVELTVPIPQIIIMVSPGASSKGAKIRTSALAIKTEPNGREQLRIAKITTTGQA